MSWFCGIYAVQLQFCKVVTQSYFGECCCNKLERCCCNETTALLNKAGLGLVWFWFKTSNGRNRPFSAELSERVESKEASSIPGHDNTRIVYAKSPGQALGQAINVTSSKRDKLKLG